MEIVDFFFNFAIQTVEAYKSNNKIIPVSVPLSPIALDTLFLLSANKALKREIKREREICIQTHTHTYTHSNI